MNGYRRPLSPILLARLTEERRFIQVVFGPRQCGKTTLVTSVLKESGLPNRYISADEPTLRGRTWLEAEWEAARFAAKQVKGFVLAIDEVQKVTGWSETVKRLWDEDTAAGRDVRVIILGSSPLLVERGLTESLAGRFELLRMTHWTWPEMRDAFGWSLDEFIFFGGYPGSAGLIGDPVRWRSYIIDSLIETTISRDLLLLSRVDKPALLRRLFQLGCDYTGQILSFNKMLGQLQDAGNTTTLAHYLELLSGCGMVTGLQKYSGSDFRRRASSPKLLALNCALPSALKGYTLDEAKADSSYWGRLVETAVGDALAGPLTSGGDLTYWRRGGLEVDYVVRHGGKLLAIEVKSGPRSASRSGLAAFSRVYNGARPLIIGGDGVPIESFLSTTLSEWLG